MVYEGSRISIKGRTPFKKKNMSSRLGLATLPNWLPWLNRSIVRMKRMKRMKVMTLFLRSWLDSRPKKERVGVALLGICLIASSRIIRDVGSLSLEEDIHKGIGLTESNVLVGEYSASIDPLANPAEEGPCALTKVMPNPRAGEGSLSRKLIISV
ncbi:hypothetical protein Ddye_023686 [Dipteronia dyeriana]|uniref:Uncharacterized protein n=1 Tax=Dipteronia dyeriana TaxID=168575 RepID=A0AAD9TU19_9ROSI|nr:hypothetical protein Ddye_023686 [Dipteronia dyeriana]